MNRRGALVLTGLLLGAGAQAVTVTASPTPLSAEARTPLTFAVELQNPSAQPQRGTLTLALPPGWTLLAGDPSYELAPGESRLELLTLLPPARLNAGALTLRVASPESAVNVQVQVPAAPRLEIEVLDAPVASASAQYSVTWRVTNTGNVDQELQLSGQGDGTQVQLSRTRLPLAPGEAAEVQARVQVPPGGRAQPLQVTLKVQGQGAAATSRASTDRVLRRPAPAQLSHVFPLQLTVGGGTAAPGQVDFTLTGQGAPVQGDPGTLHLSASRTAFQVTYARPDAAWSAGHLSPQQHPLLAAPLLGAAGTRRLGPVTFSAYAGQRQGQFSVGGGLLAQGAQGQLGLELDRTGPHLKAGLYGQVQGGLGAGRVQASGALALNLSTGGAAAEAKGLYQMGGAELSLQYAGATAGWKGAAAPTQTLSAGLNLRPQADLTLGVQLGLQGSGPLTPRLSASASVRRHFGQLGVSALLSPAAQSVAGTLNHTWGSTPLRHQVTWTAPTVDAGPQLSYQVGATRRQDTLQLLPTAGFSHDLRSGQTVLSGGLRADYRASPQTTYSAAVNTTNLRAGQFSAELNATHARAGGATSALSARVSHQDARWRGELRAAVTLAVEVPVHRRADLARVEGRILLPGGAGAAGLLLRAGDLATETDAEGRFVFEALPAGSVTLSLLGGTLPPGTQLEPALPLLLDLRPQETRRLEVRGLQTATLSGRVQLQLPENPEVRELLSADLPPLGGLDVQLSAPGQAPLTVAPNPDGSFSFPGLRPGTYTLQFAPQAQALLAGHGVPAPLEVTLRGAEQREVDLAVQWRPREVRIDDVQELTPAPLPPQTP
ncbi:hypothetical protein [Deinococcus arcticus]|uniref:Alpha-galactosidase NEW3 domain-containing protein n=1 Tax=Deinococcus arcticus TaxID=2136176 RepID=A0A2T3W8U5_9DEIO|nr:hypothetical protein [Deinococcus arcticus]PTA68214.1 hypothetical protein C8263_09145 [Deinococcus arcticus]